MRLSAVEVRVSLTLLLVLGTLFLLLCYLVQPWYEYLCLVFLYLVMLCSVGIPGRTTFSLKGNGGGMDLVERGGEGLWEEWKERKLQLGCIM